MTLKINDAARVKTPIISGVVTKVKYDEDTGEKRVTLEWTDEAGQHQERVFAEAELEFVAPPSDAAPAA